MALNITELLARIAVVLVPTIDATGLSALWSDDLAPNLVCRKDVINSETPAASVVTFDFSDNTVTYTANAGANDLAVTISNLQDGDVRFLSITKAADKEITFVSPVIDATLSLGRLKSFAGVVTYRVTNKNSVISVTAIDIDTSITMTPATINTAGGWAVASATYEPLSYWLDEFGNLRIQGSVDGSGATSTLITTLPSGFRPAKTTQCTAVGLFVCEMVWLNVDGTMNINAGATTKAQHFSIFIPKEFLA